MGYKNIYIKTAKKLSYKNCSLIVEKDDVDEEIVIPLEDIASILLEDQSTVVTSYLLAKLSKYYISMIICDDKYLPASLITPINMHYQQVGVFQKQLNAKKPLISKIWTKIVKQKMINQMQTLANCSMDLDKVNQISEHINDIKSNDKTNREAIVANLYFKGMFGLSFRRRRNEADGVNIALNYGYSVMAAHLTRLLIMYGLNTNIGIHHESNSNSLNLSYDFVETFRPIVDKYVYERRNELLDTTIDMETRQGLISLLEDVVYVNDKKYSVQNAMEEMVKSFIQCLNEDSSEFLVTPVLLFDETEGTE